MYRFQITTNVPPPGSTLEIFAESSRSFRPVRARLELNTSDQLHDKQPDKPLWVNLIILKNLFLFIYFFLL